VDALGTLLYLSDGRSVDVGGKGGNCCCKDLTFDNDLEKNRRAVSEDRMGNWGMVWGRGYSQVFDFTYNTIPSR
jgi:hypothetical protein